MSIDNLYNNTEISVKSLHRAEVGNMISVILEVEVPATEPGKEATVTRQARMFRVASREGSPGRAVGGVTLELRDLLDERRKVVVKSRSKLPKGWVFVRRMSSGTNERSANKATETVANVKAPKVAKTAQKVQESPATSSVADLIESI